MSNLLSSLPPRYSSCGQLTLLLQALEQELARLEAAAQTAAARGIIANADEAGLIRWEDDFDLPHRPDLTLEGRRAILHAALNRACHGTAAALKSYAQDLTGTDSVQILQDYAAYTLTLTAPKSNLIDFYSLQHWIHQRTPVHVVSRCIPAETELLVENS